MAVTPTDTQYYPDLSDDEKREATSWIKRAVYEALAGPEPLDPKAVKSDSIRLSKQIARLLDEAKLDREAANVALQILLEAYVTAELRSLTDRWSTHQTRRGTLECAFFGLKDRR